MEELNTRKDCYKYLKSGRMSKPFLKDSFVLKKVKMDVEAKKSEGKKSTEIESLMRYIHHIVTISHDKEFIKNTKFQRTAKEIWDSKTATGCTDYALLFATLARQIGYPTTMLHSAEKEWVDQLQQSDITEHRGHTFCECFVDEKWILVDPTFRRIQTDYNPNLLKLDYKVGDSQTFIPYDRQIDLGGETVHS